MLTYAGVQGEEMGIATARSIYDIPAHVITEIHGIELHDPSMVYLPPLFLVENSVLCSRDSNGSVWNECEK
jgi:hypothetical protein